MRSSFAPFARMRTALAEKVPAMAVTRRTALVGTASATTAARRRTASEKKAACTRALFVSALACVVALSAFAFATPTAFADESEPNIVNESQTPDSSFLYDTEISELVHSDSLENNRTVQITGEVVGDLIDCDTDPGKSWITVASTKADDDSSLQVVISDEQAKTIDTFGRYGQTGTVVVIMGTFHLACTQHDGLTDIHADSMSVVSKGVVTKEPFSISTFAIGLVLVAIGVALLLYYRRIQEGLR